MCGIPSAYAGQSGRRLATCMKGHLSAVRRQDENSLLTMHCLTTGHAFDWTRASIAGNGSTERSRELIGNARARSHKPSVAPPSFSMLIIYLIPPPYLMLLFVLPPPPSPSSLRLTHTQLNDPLIVATALTFSPFSLYNKIREKTDLFPSAASTTNFHEVYS